MKHCAGILLFKRINNKIFVLLGHPGGPFWTNKDDGCWSILKGEIQEESPFQASLREFEEESGINLSNYTTKYSKYLIIKQNKNKIVHVFYIEDIFNIDFTTFQSNTCEVEFPPNSGKSIIVPEIDKLSWFDLELARVKINKGQATLLQEEHFI